MLHHSLQAIGASDEQLDVFNEVWFCVLLDIGHASSGMEFTADPFFSYWHNVVSFLNDVFTF